MLSIIIFIPCIAGGNDVYDVGVRDEIYSHAGGSDGAWKEVGRLSSKRGSGAATLVWVSPDVCK